MPIIIISAEDFAAGKALASQLADGLGYRFLGRELLDRLAGEKGLAREDLVWALEEAPGLLTRENKRKRLLSHIEAACIDELLTDNVVCHGLAAHLYVKGVSHALKVRIIAESGAQGPDLACLQHTAPRNVLKKGMRVQQEQRKWSEAAYGLDQTDPSLYDLVIALGKVERGKIIEIICDMVGYRKFQPMTYSLNCMKDRALAAKVRRELVGSYPGAGVEARDGTVVVNIKSGRMRQRKKQEQVRQLAGDIPGVRHLEVYT